VKDKLARQKAKDDIQKLHDQVDDLRNAGKSPTEIATTLKLKVIDIAQNTRRENGPRAPRFESSDLCGSRYQNQR
jgi:hypothetical protein